MLGVSFFSITRRMALARPKSHRIGKASATDVAGHYAHATGQDCPRCGAVITAAQTARRVGEHDWVHDMCPSRSA